MTCHPGPIPNGAGADAQAPGQVQSTGDLACCSSTPPVRPAGPTHPLVDEGLGNSAHLPDPDDGRALAVDPSLDTRATDRAADIRGHHAAYAAETHLHAGFRSGVRHLAIDHGAQVLASAAGHRTFDHVRLGDGDEVDLGGRTMRAGHPGHTRSTCRTSSSTDRARLVCSPADR
jgi:hypothetical protein